MSHKDPIVNLIGEKHFQWLSREFSKQNTIKDIPDDILNRIASVDITIRNYGSDRNAVTSIAVITFAYKMANMTQDPRLGAKDILLLKALAKMEKSRRHGKNHSQNTLWDAPLFELITGPVGERIRNTRTINSPT